MTTERRTGRARPVGVALAVVALVAIPGLVVASPLFHVSTFHVDGNTRLSDEDVRGLSGVRIGENLVFLSTAEVEASVESSPWIADATVQRDLPDRLVVRVSERRVIGWARGGISPHLVGHDGVVVEEMTEPPSLPWLGRYPELQEGERIPGSLGSVRVLASLSPSVLGIVRTAKADDGIVLRFTDGSYALYGAATEVGRKTAALEALLAWAGERGTRFRYIDVRVPDSPVIRPVRGPRRTVERPSEQP